MLLREFDERRGWTNGFLSCAHWLRWRTGIDTDVERLVRAWRYCDRMEDGRKHLAREASCHVDEDGMVIVRARLTPEQGAIVQKALQAASDRLYRESRHAAPPANITEEVTFRQRQADALTMVAEAALAADLDRGSAGDRYQVVLHVETRQRRSFQGFGVSSISPTAASAFPRTRRAG